MLNVAVLGAGFMGGAHARAFARLEDVNLIAVSSRSEERARALAEELGCEWTTDSMALVDDPRVEAVSITLPTHLHRDATLAAFAAGKDVLVEKPMALTVEDCDAMIAAADEADRLLMVAHVLRFWPEYVALAEVLQSGELGAPISAVASRLCEPPGWAEWFKDASLSGGEVLDLHIHDLDTLNWLFGEPDTLYAQGRRGAHGGWDQAMTMIDYGGVKCFAEGNAIMPAGYPFTMTLSVRCELGNVEYTLRAGGEQVDSSADGINSLMVYQPGQPPRVLEMEAGDGYQNEVAYFAKCVQEGSRPQFGTGAQGRLAVKTALAARQSIETGEVIRFW
ncbi:MAG: Gfo/Idh/MocA family oxidoreductase [Chloroflexota bacterium]|nr:Gfo/Idh/MocA family oxidoreductase [Chloroflexota bacterium]